MTEPAYRIVIDNRDLVRATESKAILNTNKDALDKYRQERDEKVKLRKLAEDSNKMKSDIEEIKSLLRQLLGQK